MRRKLSEAGIVARKSWTKWHVYLRDHIITESGPYDYVLCAYCKKTLHFRTMTIDHVVPRSKGGTDDLSNLVVACKQCNTLKSDKLLKDMETR